MRTHSIAVEFSGVNPFNVNQIQLINRLRKCTEEHKESFKNFNLTNERGRTIIEKHGKRVVNGIKTFHRGGYLFSIYIHINK